MLLYRPVGEVGDGMAINDDDVTGSGGTGERASRTAARTPAVMTAVLTAPPDKLGE